MRYILHIAHFFARLFSLGAISRVRVEPQIGGGGCADVEVRRAAGTGGGDAGVPSYPERAGKESPGTIA